MLALGRNAAEYVCRWRAGQAQWVWRGNERQAGEIGERVAGRRMRSELWEAVARNNAAR